MKIEVGKGFPLTLNFLSGSLSNRRSGHKDNETHQHGNGPPERRGRTIPIYCGGAVRGCPGE